MSPARGRPSSTSSSSATRPARARRSTTRSFSSPRGEASLSRFGSHGRFVCPMAASSPHFRFSSHPRPHLHSSPPLSPLRALCLLSALSFSLSPSLLVAATEAPRTLCVAQRRSPARRHGAPSNAGVRGRVRAPGLARPCLVPPVRVWSTKPYLPLLPCRPWRQPSAPSSSTPFPPRRRGGATPPPAVCCAGGTGRLPPQGPQRSSSSGTTQQMSPTGCLWHGCSLP